MLCLMLCLKGSNPVSAAHALHHALPQNSDPGSAIPYYHPCSAPNEAILAPLFQALPHALPQKQQSWLRYYMIFLTEQTERAILDAQKPAILAPLSHALLDRANEKDVIAGHQNRSEEGDTLK